MRNKYLLLVILIPASIIFIVIACLIHDDKQISIAFMSFILLIASLAGSIIGEKEKNKQVLSGQMIKQMIVLFGCSLAAILIGYLVDYLIVGCIISFMLGCLVLINIKKTMINNS